MKLVFKSAVSVTFELDNNLPYFNDKTYNVYLDDVIIHKDIKTNVFSIYDLKPNTNYVVKALDKSISFKTEEVSKIYDVLSYGAVNDDVTDNTSLFQEILDKAQENSLIIIPPGTYHTCALFLRSNLTIELKKGATLLAEVDRNKYPILKAQVIREDGSILEQSSWEGVPQDTFASILTGIEISNVKIVGEGIIDANAQNSDWWINPKQKRIAWRPKGIFISNSSYIGLQGITVMNTPSWNLHPYFSSHLDFIDIKLISPKDSPNTDGCDPESCSDIRLIGINFSVGDDCIAIKSGKFEMGMKYRKPTERMLIRNCYMAHGHGAVVLGSECSGGIKDLTVEKCYFYNTDRGLRIKTRRGRGESMIIDGIVFENIIMDHVKVPLVANMYYFCDDDGKTPYVWSKEALPIDEKTPFLGKFTFKNIKATNAHAAAGFFYGLKEMPIEAIRLENVKIDFTENPEPFIPAMMSFLEPQVKQGLQFRNVKAVQLKNVNIFGVLSEDIILENVEKYNRN